MDITGDYDWKNGFVSGAVYYYSEELVELLTKVYGMASYTNPLHVDIFPGICKMEAEIVRICANLFHGSENSCGTVNNCFLQWLCMSIVSSVRSWFCC